MARRYWIDVDGARLYHDTLGAAKAAAKVWADKLGRSIQGGYDEISAPLRARRNPLPDFDIPAYADAQERARRRHLDYLAATKARRLAKGLRGRGQVAKKEAAAQKTGKFAIDVRGRINGIQQAFTLYRPSRGAAEAVGADFAAQGCKVTLRPV